MNHLSLTRTLGGLLVIGTLMGVAAALQRVRDAQYPPPPVAEASLYLTSGTTARHLAIGYSALAADLYWIRAVQYYGDMKLRLARSEAARRENPEQARSEYELLYPLLDLTTTLDPRFNIAYRFGSIFLAEPLPGGAGRPDLAIQLLEKGLREKPDKWEYMQDIGFVQYWWYQDYRTAAEWFDKASHVDGAPWFLRSLAATTLAEGGDRQSSRTMWQAIYDSAEIEWLRNDAARRLQQLDTADRIDQIQRRLDGVAARVGVITEWQTAVRMGLLPGIPIDVAGVPLVIGPSGRVDVSPTSPLFPLPKEPRRIVPPAS